MNCYLNSKALDGKEKLKVVLVFLIGFALSVGFRGIFIMILCNF